MALFLIIGLSVGTPTGYYYRAKVDFGAHAVNDLEVILLDQEDEKVISNMTNRLVEENIVENSKLKDFDCSSAILPDTQLQLIQDEIDSARRRSNTGLFDNTTN